MIKSFKHKGLKKYYDTGSKAGIQASHAKKLKLILSTIDGAKVVSDTDFPGANLHPLKGDKKDLWSVAVNGNWRITFKFENGDAYILNYEDYH